jgi:methylenetetrahydrofolate reductase (NADPH)
MRATDSLGQVLSSGQRSFSFELFPPKTDEGERMLWQTVREIEALKPTFVSVTYGAGGSSQDRTVRVTGHIAEDTTLTPVGHLTCVGASRDQLRDVVGQYASVGVKTMLALRGDPPSGLDTPVGAPPRGAGARGGARRADPFSGLVQRRGRRFSRGAS